MDEQQGPSHDWGWGLEAGSELQRGMRSNEGKESHQCSVGTGLGSRSEQCKSL